MSAWLSPEYSLAASIGPNSPARRATSGRRESAAPSSPPRSARRPTSGCLERLQALTDSCFYILRYSPPVDTWRPMARRFSAVHARIRRLPRLQQSERLQKPHIAHDPLPVPLQFARQLRDGYRPCTNRLQHPDAFGREYLYQVRRVFKNHSDLGRYAFTPIQLARALAGSREELVHGPSRQRYGRKSAASHSIHPPPSTRSPS